MKLSKKQRLFIQLYKTKFRAISLISKRKAAESLFTLFCTPYSGKPKRKIPPFFKKANELKISYDGLTLKGWQWSPNNCNLKKILVVHGFDSCSYKSETIIHKLYISGFEVFAFDAMGHGESEGKTLNAKQYADILETIHKQHQLYAIVAHSIGGLSTCLAAEQGLKGVDKLILVAPATETTRAIDNFFKFLKMPIALKPELNKYITKAFGSTLDFFSVSRAIQNVQQKILWVHDKKDFICPFEDTISTQEKNLSNLEFYITSGLGHNAIYRNPNVLQKIVFFLSE